MSHNALLNLNRWRFLCSRSVAGIVLKRRRYSPRPVRARRPAQWWNRDGATVSAGAGRFRHAALPNRPPTYGPRVSYPFRVPFRNSRAQIAQFTPQDGADECIESMYCFMRAFILSYLPDPRHWRCPNATEDDRVTDSPPALGLTVTRSRPRGTAAVVSNASDPAVDAPPYQVFELSRRGWTFAKRDHNLRLLIVGLKPPV
ncbi:unnamed protein product, partial [Iphiclides podalirius]